MINLLIKSDIYLLDSIPNPFVSLKLTQQENSLGLLLQKHQMISVDTEYCKTLSKKIIITKLKISLKIIIKCAFIIEN